MEKFINSTEICMFGHSVELKMKKTNENRIVGMQSRRENIAKALH